MTILDVLIRLDDAAHEATERSIQRHPWLWVAVTVALLAAVALLAKAAMP